LLLPKQFTIALLDFIGSQAQYFHSAQVLQHAATAAATASTNGDLIDLSSAQSRPATPDSPQTAQRVANMETALQALCNVIKYNAGVESACIGQFRLMFSLLRVQRNTTLQLLSVYVLSAVSGSAECVEDIASSEVLSNLLLLIRPHIPIAPKPGSPVSPGSPKNTDGSLASQRAMASKLHTSVLEVLLPLMANSRLVREALKYGAVLYLLEQFCVGGGAATQQRERCAELLGKMAADKLVGPKVRLQLGRFLPPLFIDAMTDSTSGAVQLFDASQENPELIWNEASRSAVMQTLRRLASELATVQLQEPNTAWEPPEQMPLLQQQQSMATELQVAGVYVRLFVANPGWLLRRPKQFLTESLEQLQRLLQMTTEQIKAEESQLKMLGAGVSALLNAQPALMELIPAMGFVPALLDACNSSRPLPAIACCVRLLEQLSLSKSCVDTMLQHRQLVARMEDAIRADRTLAGSVCDCLLRVLRIEPEQLMSQAMAGQLIPLLLQLLDEPQTGSTGKAQVVRLLKEMCDSGLTGEQLKARLDQTSVWKEFRDQKHDLFISAQPTAAGYIAGAAPNVAGYLTQGAGSTVESTLNPPPIDDY
jgi:DnaJ family protein C protein 13